MGKSPISTVKVPEHQIHYPTIFGNTRTTKDEASTKEKKLSVFCFRSHAVTNQVGATLRYKSF